MVSNWLMKAGATGAAPLVLLASAVLSVVLLWSWGRKDRKEAEAAGLAT